MFLHTANAIRARLGAASRLSTCRTCRCTIVLGRGYLPNARLIELPMGWRRRSRTHAGVDDLKFIEDARAARSPPTFCSTAHRDISPSTGACQRSQSGNEILAVGVYDLRPCLKTTRAPGGALVMRKARVTRAACQREQEMAGWRRC